MPGSASGFLMYGARNHALFCDVTLFRGCYQNCYRHCDIAVLYLGVMFLLLRCSLACHWLLVVTPLSICSCRMTTSLLTGRHCSLGWQLARGASFTLAQRSPIAVCRGTAHHSSMCPQPSTSLMYTHPWQMDMATS